MSTRKKSIIWAVTLVVIVLTTVTFMGFLPQEVANAESVVWEQIDISTPSRYNFLVSEFSLKKQENGLWLINDGTEMIPLQQYLYVFIQGAGGMGGNESGNTTGGYGGGSGGFAVIKINLQFYNAGVLFSIGKGGGKFPDQSADGIPFGQGYHTGVGAIGSGLNYNRMILSGGGKGTIYEAGCGGNTSLDRENDPNFQVLYRKDGCDGGKNSPFFSVNIGFRTETFMFHAAGAYPSGQGGGGSAYNRGGDGGVWGFNGKDGTKGSGGGGAGHGDKLPGLGGDGYMEVYTCDL